MADCFGMFNCLTKAFVKFSCKSSAITFCCDLSNVNLIVSNLFLVTDLTLEEQEFCIPAFVFFFEFIYNFIFKLLLLLCLDLK